jgi:putative ABC transport system substrate-binding protein
MSKAKTVKQLLNTLLLSLSLSSALNAAPPPKHIAITQFVEHVAADAVREGLLAELKKQGIDVKVDFENAQGNTATASQIAQKLVSLKPDVIVAITTPSAQSVVKVTGKDTIPVVFSAVTDPIRAGLVSSLKDHKGNVTGVMDAPPIKEQIAFIRKLLPEAKTIGVLYNPGDNGSVASLDTIRKEAKENGFNLIEATPVKSSDIQSAFLSLVGKIDALYVPLDNMVVSAMGGVAGLALTHNLPLFTADSGSVKDGAFACLGYSYVQTGHTTGKIVAEILQGKSPREIPVASPATTDIFINQVALEKLKIALPDAVRKQAHFY